MARSLPILQIDSSTSDEVLTRFFHRARLHWWRHLAEETACDVGTALVNSREPAFNAVLEAAMPQGESAIEAVKAVLGSHGIYRNWVMNPSAPIEQTRPLVEGLLAEGFQTRIETIYYFPEPSVPRGLDGGDLKILPARAAYVQVSELGHAVTAELGRRELAEAAMLHLDDGHYDALVAMQDGRPIGRVGVLAVGEIGLIEELYVVAVHRGREIEKRLLGRAMEIGARSRFRHLFAGVGHGDHAGRLLLETVGFTPIGDWVMYHK